MYFNGELVVYLRWRKYVDTHELHSSTILIHFILCYTHLMLQNVHICHV